MATQQLDGIIAIAQQTSIKCVQQATSKAMKEDPDRYNSTITATHKLLCECIHLMQCYDDIPNSESIKVVKNASF